MAHEDIVHELVTDAIVILENRIGSDDEQDTDQSVLSLLNDADREILSNS